MTSRFATIDDCRQDVAGIPISDAWWSRKAEYPWAFQFARKDDTVVDTGCGIRYPFKNALATVCGSIYAIDSDPDVLNDKCPPNISLMVADICNMSVVPSGIADRVFCISVFEHIDGQNRVNALREMSRVLRNDGLIVLTQDIYINTKDKCINDFLLNMRDAHLAFDGDFNLVVPSNVLFTMDYGNGLYVFLSALKKA